jgi:hypothetical protein
MGTLQTNSVKHLTSPQFTRLPPQFSSAKNVLVISGNLAGTIFMLHA